MSAKKFSCRQFRERKGCFVCFPFYVLNTTLLAMHIEGYLGGLVVMKFGGVTEEGGSGSSSELRS